MKDKLIKQLGLKPAAGQTEVSDEQVIFAVAEIQSQNHQHHGAAAYENEIQAVIREGGGAISREIAKEILTRRAGESASNAPK